MAAPKSESTQPPAPWATLYGSYVGSLAVAVLGNLLIRLGTQGGWLSGSSTVALGALTAVPLMVAAGFFWRLLRQDLDEMLQRIALEGLAFAVIVFVPLAALYVNLRTAGVWIPRLDPPELLMAPAWLVAIGIAIAQRRYQ